MPAFLAIPAVRYGLLALVVFGLFYWALDSYGDRQYDKGKADADAAWQKASDKLIAKSQNAATKADRTAAAREADFAARVEDEKEKLEDANANGSSPIDVLFSGN